ncbi:MAG: 16S rRNA (cytosine(967)-C(5))-methyltransferase [Deltaproteobacteria bacterium RBG_13_52_11]|nr:MAG: 16S rRNA (cytosine(967)-C(5))-methyltransferase [Deltaproteobacteria bacterium RBG_13_52_11]
MDRARTKALEVLIRLEKRGSPMDPLFDELVMEDPLLTDLDKAFVREVVYGVLRWRGRLDWVISAYSRIKPLRMERVVLSILRMGTYQLLFMDRVPSRAAVDESVKLAKGKGRKDVAPFINGILRGIAEGRKEIAYPPIHTEPLDYIAAYHSHPRWMVRRWLDQWGVDETVSLCTANNQIPPLTVRVNVLKGSRDEVINRLHDEKIEATPPPFSPVGVFLQKPPPLTSWGLFQEGWLQVQDEASQLVSFILAPRPGERVLDICAAPGGKTTHVAQLMEDEGEIVAVDVSPIKLSLLQENCRRLGISIVKALLTLDAQSPLPFSDGSFDRVLVDAPCTGLGTLRRNPDGKWRVAEADIPRLQKLQGRILAQAAPMVKQGGILVYSTCTMTPEENEGVIGPFLSEQGGVRLEGVSSSLPPGCEGLTDQEGYFRTFPHCHGTDGFFAARMRRE